jgi:glycosyltransferase involved in cell wall biosynthesis
MKATKQMLVVKEDVIGGGQIATERLLESLKTHHSEITCHCIVFKERHNSKNKLVFIRSFINQFLGARSRISNAFAKNDIDYVCVSDYLLALATISVRPRTVKILYLFHGLKEVYFKKPSLLDFGKVIIKNLEKLSWILSDVITVPSGEAKEFILNKTPLIDSKKIFVVSNIVPQEYFTSKAKHKNVAGFNILYSGRIVKYKGLENLILAFARITFGIPKALLIIAHPISGSDLHLKSDLDDLIKSHGLERKVIFIKNSSEKGLIDLYRSSDVLVLPSELEFAPLSVIESLASGTPVIGTDVGNIKSLLLRLDGRLVLKNNSVDEIYNKILWFFHFNKRNRHTLRKKAREISLSFSDKKSCEEFNWALKYLNSNTSH